MTPGEKLIRALPRDPAIEIRGAEGKNDGNTARAGPVADFIAERRSRQEGTVTEQRVCGNPSCAGPRRRQHLHETLNVPGTQTPGDRESVGGRGWNSKTVVLPTHRCE